MVCDADGRLKTGNVAVKLIAMCVDQGSNCAELIAEPRGFWLVARLPIAETGPHRFAGNHPHRVGVPTPLDIEAGWTVEDAHATGWPNDHPDRVEARWRAIQGNLGVNHDALPGEGR
jgi:hypothetical protein